MVLVCLGRADDTLSGGPVIPEGEEDDLSDQDRSVEAEEESGPPVGSLPPAVLAFMEIMKPMMEGNTAAIAALAKAQASTVSGGGKRKREDEEEEEALAKSRPILIHKVGHELKDDAHSIIDWEARKLRPYNGRDWELYWSKIPMKALPVVEDVDLDRLTKAPINPNVLRKLHDRGQDLTAKQWLSSNYVVEGKGGRIRAENDRTAGAFVLDYLEPSGVWEAVDAVHNYTAALRCIRPEDHTGELMLRTLHDCRMFNGPSFSPVEQKKMIMNFFDQVLKTSAMKGRMKRPPMSRKEMLELAKQLLFAKGVDGLASFMNLEPYTVRGATKSGPSGSKGNAGGPSGSSRPIEKL